MLQLRCPKPSSDVDNAPPIGPIERRRTERRAAIVELARQMFFENGYRRTSMSAIAAALGGSKSTLWQCFQSKELLLVAVVQQAVGTFHSDLQATVNDPGMPEDILIAFGERYIEKVENPASISLQRMIIAESAHVPEIGQVFYDRAIWPTREILSTYIARLMASGHLRRDDASIAADALIALCAGARHQCILLNVQTFAAKAVPGRARDAVSKFMDLFGIEGGRSGACRPGKS